MNIYDILTNIPHEHIQSDSVKPDERFDIFHLGTFTVEHSFLQHFTEKKQSVDEIVELVSLQENTDYRAHYHEKSSAMVYMVLGEGIITLDNNQVPYRPGMRWIIPAKTAHGFITKTKTLFLSIQSPPIRNYDTGTVDLHYVKES